MKEGDRNISYFHKLANSGARHSSFVKLVIDEVLVEDKEQIVDHVVGLHETL